MDIKTVHRLRELNNEFYQNHCGSFSRTRTGSWRGWFRCIETIEEKLPATGILLDETSDEVEVFSVFDLGCGNLRFKTFLESAFPDISLAYFAVDDCQDMLPHHSDESRQLFSVHFQDLDAIEVLANGEDLSEQIDAPLCDLSVSFGFMHHVPTQELRKRALQALVAQTLPGGLVIVSFWQFAQCEDLLAKAIETDKKARAELDLPQLEEGDYLIGWQNIEGAYRYCHSFTDAEIDELVASVADKTTVVSRFTSDGKTENLNTYVVFQVK